jgi:aryl-alcohol dehydrogenase-like predicted oxidoreductase
VRAIGSSNFTAAMVEEAHSIAAQNDLTPYVSEQSEYSWLARGAEAELLPACERLGVGFIPYFPLASGLLTGKYRRGEPPPEGTRLHGRELDEAKLDRVERLEAFASERGATLLEVAIGGLLAQPSVASVIAGATKPGQVRENAESGRWEPSDEDLAAVRSL